MRNRRSLKVWLTGAHCCVFRALKAINQKNVEKSKYSCEFFVNIYQANAWELLKGMKEL